MWDAMKVLSNMQLRDSNSVGLSQVFMFLMYRFSDDPIKTGKDDVNNPSNASSMFPNNLSFRLKPVKYRHDFFS